MRNRWFNTIAIALFCVSAVKWIKAVGLVPAASEKWTDGSILNGKGKNKMNTRGIAISTALLAIAIGTQAAVTFKPTSLTPATTNVQTFIFTDVGSLLVDTPCTGSRNKVTGSFSGGSGSVTVTVTAASGFIMNDAVNNINNSSFGTYINGLPNELVNVNSDDWAVTSATNDVDTGKLSNSEALIFDFDLSGLDPDTELSLNQIQLTQAGMRESLFAYLYHSASNAVVYNSTAFEDDKVAHSFTNRIYHGDRLVLATRDSRNAISTPLTDERNSTVRLDWMSLDTYAPAPDYNRPLYITDVTASNKKVVLNWDDDWNTDLLDYYNVYRSLESNADFQVEGVATDSAYTDENVTNDVTYYYYARAFSTNSVEATNLNVVAATPFVAVPTGLAAESYDGEVVLTWDTSDSALFSSFNLYKGYSSTDLPDMVSMTTNTYTDTNVFNEITYYYAVSMVDTNGDESALSSAVGVEPSEALIIVANANADSDLNNLQGDIRTSPTGINEFFNATGERRVGSQDLIGVYNFEGNDRWLSRPTLGFPLLSEDLGIFEIDDIEKITLRIYTFMNTLSNVSGFATNVVLFHSQERPVADISTDDFALPSWVEVGAVPGLVMGAEHGWYEIDVTAQVKSDLSLDLQDGTAGPSFQFRANGNDLGTITTNIPFYVLEDPTYGNEEGLQPVGTLFNGSGVKFNDNQAKNDGRTGSPFGPAFIPQLKIKFKDTRSGFQQWASVYLPISIGNQSADYDEDGVNNFNEYGLGGDATDPADQGTMPTIGAVMGGGYAYVMPQRSGDSNLVYTVQKTDNLRYGPWVNSDYTVQGINVTGDTLDFVTNMVDTVDDKQFIRLKIDYITPVE